MRSDRLGPDKVKAGTVIVRRDHNVSIYHNLAWSDLASNTDITQFRLVVVGPAWCLQLAKRI